MSSYEDQVRRQLEQSAAEQQCPVDGDLDAAFSFKDKKKAFKKRRDAGGINSSGTKDQVVMRKGGGGTVKYGPRK